MPIDPFQPFSNPITGETFRCLSSTAEAYTTEWVVQPGGYVPFQHVHLSQEEVFHIRRGELRLLIEGREEIGRAGQTLTIPRGARQIAYNNLPEVLDCVLEYRPALDSFQVFQCFGGLTLDGELDRHGLVNPLKMMYFLQRLHARSLVRPAYLPAPLFRFAMLLSFAAGSLAGWEKQYLKYTG